eukprot:CAMPEP_0196765022 /NCGR_PEP_ID=MMETSP1095-20130614/7402_1 /TAXON_ID=96789 ORGANISM="Chromulina nebulosa, Strain UTEXLB2642" /NCGR_SAMPLE_ID=MMETSP1095 /ASSEMBLY_ACC=CAM_ASM_000446 /LENGTH=648 /DNA_ID=CAMNT_0042122185 /DNA_START=1305 /DNA_END=3248 /DNA_ORIENTATION=+
MLTHHETEREAIRRRWNAADAATLAREKGIFPNIEPSSNIDITTIRPNAPFPVTETSNVIPASRNTEKVIQDREDSAVLSILMNSSVDNQVSKPGTMMAETAAMMEMEIQLRNNNAQTMIDNSEVFQTVPFTNKPIISTNTNSSKSNTNSSTSLPPPIDTSMLSTITESITKMLSSMDSSNPQDMIQLGLGMGMAMMSAGIGQSLVDNKPAPSITNKIDSPNSLSFQSSSFLSPRSQLSNESSSLQLPYISDQIVEKQLSNIPVSKVSNSKTNMRGTNGPEPIGLPTATVSTSANKVLDHSEAIQQAQLVNKNLTNPLTTIEKARKIVVATEENGLAISQTPDVTKLGNVIEELPRNADEKVKNKVPVLLYPELSTILPDGPPPESITHPLAGEISTENSSEIVLNNSTDGVVSILRRPVMPLPTGFHEAIIAAHVAKQEVDYLPQVPNLPQTRTVGRVKPRSTALDWIAISFDPWSAGKAPVTSEFVSSLSANAEKFFEGGAVKAADAVDQLRAETVAGAFANIQDVEGQQIQRAEISRAQVMLQDFNKICSLCRHNKYNEIEQLINQPDWSLPIDYQDEQGNTLLHIAAQNGNKRMIKICLRRGITLDVQNLQGQTALHYLYGYGYTDVGDYLVKKGANDSIRNND